MQIVPSSGKIRSPGFVRVIDELGIAMGEIVFEPISRDFIGL